MKDIRSFRAIWLTARRAGPRRSFHRLRRYCWSALVDPLLASRLYRPPALSAGSLSRTDEWRETLACLARLRETSRTADIWDRSANVLTLLNQPPFPMVAPVDWQARPVEDPLWAFRLHGWEWAWPALSDATARQPLLSLWHDWIARVPVGRGLAWEPYPTSRRIVVWAVAWHLLGGDPELAAAVAQHATYLANHLERDLDNNHLVANARALAWAGLLFADFPKAERWRSLGLGLLWEALGEQVRKDGGHVENSTSYHLAVWLDGLETALLCRSGGEVVPGVVWETLARMGDYALALRRPDGRLPLLNDSIEDEPLPARQVFALAAIVFGRSDLACAAGERGALVPGPRPHVFPDSGYAVLRSGLDSESTYLVFDAGDLGPVHCPGHGHADTLSIELWDRGEALILDPGVYQYLAGSWRDYFRSTAAHSTATVDGLDQSCFTGPFRVADMARGRFVRRAPGDSESEVEGEHDGYARLPDPVIHRRRVSLPHRHHVVIEDAFTGREQHRIVLRFHLAPGRVELDGTSAQVTYPGGARLHMHVDSPVTGALGVEEGWISRTWYRKEASHILVYAFEACLPVTTRTSLKIM